VTAPGERIISTIPGNQYAVWNGTSMAAPLAAGEAALVWAVQPTWDAQAVVEHLIATAMPIAGAVPYRLDAAEALGVVVTPVLTINGTAATDDIQLQVGPTTGQVVVLNA
jgi:subtilisin family serine protease